MVALGRYHKPPLRDTLLAMRILLGFSAFGLISVGAITNCGLSLSGDASNLDAAIATEVDGRPDVPLADSGMYDAVPPGENSDASVDTPDADSDDPPDATAFDAGAFDAGTGDAGADPICDGYQRGVSFEPAEAPKPRSSYNGRCYWISTQSVSMSNLNNAFPVCGALGGFPVVVSIGGGGAGENAVINALRATLGAGNSNDPWMGLAYFRPPAQLADWRWLSTSNRPNYGTVLGNATETNGGCTRLTTAGQWLQTYCSTGNPTRRVVCERIYLQ
jgi:hypothetical protein